MPPIESASAGVYPECLGRFFSFRVYKAVSKKAGLGAVRRDRFDEDPESKGRNIDKPCGISTSDPNVSQITLR